MTMKDLPEFTASIDSVPAISVDLSPLLYKNPVILPVSIPLANTEQSQAIPLGTKKVSLKSKTDANLLIGYTAGGPYFLVPAGALQEINQLDSTVAITLYFKSSKNSDILEIEYWA
jgi:hypothetical protein